MTVTTFTSREFNQDSGGAKKAAETWPRVHHGSRQARACPVEHRPLSQAGRAGGDVGRYLGAAGRCRFRVRTTTRGRLHSATRLVVTLLRDTNVLSELCRPDEANAKAVAWASSVPTTATFLSVITILEVEVGALSIGRRDEARARILRAWIDRQVLPRFEGRILPVDTSVAQRSARPRVPDPRAERDALIAATALVHGLTVVPRNLPDFEPTGVPVLNPWG